MLEYGLLCSFVLMCIVLSVHFSVSFYGFGIFCFFFSSRRRHTRCALVTGVQTCALPIRARAWRRGYDGGAAWGKRAAPYHPPCQRRHAGDAGGGYGADPAAAQLCADRRCDRRAPPPRAAASHPLFRARPRRAPACAGPPAVFGDRERRADRKSGG